MSESVQSSTQERDLSTKRDLNLVDTIEFARNQISS